MKTTMTAGAALLLSTTIVTAGGLDRAGTPYAILFEDGNQVQLSFSSTSPSVSGDYPALLGGGSTGNMAEDFTNFGGAFKYAINDQIDLALFINQPFGANANYTEGAYTGLKADWGSTKLAVVGKYEASPGFSVYGGVQAIQSEAEITIADALIRQGAAAAGSPAALAPAGTLEYTAETNADTQIGYILGAAYERPDIALRVALTYESGVTHEFDVSENVAAVPPASGDSTFEIEMPQSVTLDFQTGVAPGTLVFGSVRWAEWSVWEVRPDGYEVLTSGDRITGLDNDVYTYRLGIGRQINDDLSVFARYTFEKENGGVGNRLAPTDGSKSIGIGGSYTMDNVKFTGGVEYAMLGGTTDASGVEFEDNSAIGFGLTVAYSF